MAAGRLQGRPAARRDRSDVDVAGRGQADPAVPAQVADRDQAGIADAVREIGDAEDTVVGRSGLDADAEINRRVKFAF